MHNNDDAEPEQDWSDQVASGFEAAAAQTTHAAFGPSSPSRLQKKDTTECQDVYVCGTRVSHDWKASIWVFVLTTVIWGGFVAMHVTRILHEEETNNNNTTSNSTTTTTSAPPTDDHENSFLAKHKIIIGIISLAVTGVFYIWTIACCFLAVFTDPGRLPRKNELKEALLQQQQQSEGSYSPGDASLFAPSSPTKSQKAANNNNKTSGLPTSNLRDFENATAERSRNAAYNDEEDDDGQHTNDARSSTASSAIVFASNQNMRLARGSIRASTVKDLLSDDGKSKGAEFIVIKDVSIPTPYCTTCEIRRPVRASHCVTCQNDVLDFDHHCGIIGACIGRFNARYFTGFVWGIGLLSWLTGISSAIVAASEHSSEDNKMFALALCFCAITLILGIQLGCNLSCHYCCLFRKGYTHREWVKRDILYGGSMFGDDDKSPFYAPLGRQCQYLWCPPSADADLKAWAEGRYDEVEPKQDGLPRLTSFSSGVSSGTFSKKKSTGDSNNNNNNGGRRVSIVLGDGIVSQQYDSSKPKREAKSSSPIREENRSLLEHRSPGAGSNHSMSTVNDNNSNNNNDHYSNSRYDGQCHTPQQSSGLSDRLLPVSTTAGDQKPLSINATPSKIVDYGATSPTSYEAQHPSQPNNNIL